MTAGNPNTRTMTQSGTTLRQHLEKDMIEVFITFTGAGGRVQIPGGPFADMAAAHDALEDYAVAHHGSWRTLRGLLKSYEFIIKNAGSVVVQVRP